MFESEYFSIPILVKTQVPPLPTTIVKVSQLLADYNASQNAVAEAISLDPILSARVLRLANSSVYALHSEVTSLSAAVRAVGNNSISEMLMMSGLSDGFGRKILSSDAGKTIWRHMLAAAMATSEICRLASLRGMNDAFTCALLHDIGQMILLRADAPRYTQMLARAETEDDLTVIEKFAFGFDHAELGAAATLAWKLPESIAQIVGAHHASGPAVSDAEIIQVINTADRLAEVKTRDGDVLELFIDETFQTFDLTSAQFDAIWELVDYRCEQVLQSL